MTELSAQELIAKVREFDTALAINASVHRCNVINAALAELAP